MDVITNRLLRDAAPLFNVFAGVMLVLGIGAILSLGKEVLIPVALALLLSFALSPIVRILQHAGVGRSIAVACAVLLALCVIGAVGYVVVTQFTALAVDLPKYQSTLHEKVLRIQQSLSAGGPFSRAAATLADLAGDVQKLGQGGVKSEPVVVVSEGNHTLAAAGQYVASIFGPLASFAAVLLFTAFMLAQREDIRNRLIRLMGTDDLQQTTAALDDVGLRLARMLAAQLAMNAAFATVLGTGLWLIGLPSPFLWGVLAGVLRFVPYIGALIGGIVPMLLAFAVDPTWTSVLWTGGLFLTLEPVFGQAIEPLLFGKSSGLSPLAVLVSAALWAFLWGPVGLVLSTPLTIVLVVIGHHVSRLEFLDVLFGDKPALDLHEVFYQRMLAGDPLEARLQARDFLRASGLAIYYDTVALPALRRAHLDIMRGLVVGRRLQTLQTSVETLVAGVERDITRESGWRRMLARRLLRGQPGGRPHGPEPSDAWRTPNAVAILYSDDPLDAPAASMLKQVVQLGGLGVSAISMADARGSAPADAAGVRLVCLSFFEPLSAQHLRAASRAVHRAAPHARIIVCIWQTTGPMLAKELRRKLRVDGLATDMGEAIAAIDAFASPPQTDLASPRESRAGSSLPGRQVATS